MSTILEALRRAEAERNAPPQPLPLGAPRAQPSARPRRVWPWVLASGAAALAVAVALLLLRQPQVSESAPVASGAPALPAPAPAAASAPLPAPVALLEPARPAPVAPASAVSTAASTAASPTAPPRWAELPAATRQQLPPLQLGGSMHSPDARLRSLIVNGQLYREGDTIAPELQLVEIGPRNARLRWRGQEFLLPY